jgi:hypothetical protein
VRSYVANAYVLCVIVAMQARLEEARNALADEALAYYPEVSLKKCYRRQVGVGSDHENKRETNCNNDAEIAGFEGGNHKML